MTIRWRIVVELTFDIDQKADVKRYVDDVESDIASRALYRVKPSLNEAVGEGKPFAHYHIIEMPRKLGD